jgi:DNA-binding NtrC family response regulator
MAEPLHILVVDDNEDLLYTFSLVLKKRGFYVETATDGLIAAEMYLKGDYDVTLMDIVMPVLNGVEAFRLIREKDPEASVILMTGYSDEDLIQLALDEGAYCVMHKPIHIDKMIDTIHQATKSVAISQERVGARLKVIASTLSI